MRGKSSLSSKRFGRRPQAQPSQAILPEQGGTRASGREPVEATWSRTSALHMLPVSQEVVVKATRNVVAQAPACRRAQAAGLDAAQELSEHLWQGVRQ
jgi:hypothetical protein